MKLCLVGYEGKMGQEIVRLSKETKNIEVFKYSLKEFKKNKVDVCIDFSSPKATEEIVQLCEKFSCPLVIGTTGISDKQKKRLKVAAKKTPILWDSNMSLGVLAFKKMLKDLKIIKDYDFFIQEIHHSQKKDSPSGTALKIEEELKKHIIKNKYQGVQSIRAGGVFGVHKLLAIGKEEILTIEHQALNRAVFARGALMAAAWIKNQKPGFYNMEDIF